MFIFVVKVVEIIWLYWDYGYSYGYFIHHIQLSPI